MNDGHDENVEHHLYHPIYCRVQNLTSQKGLCLNNCSAVAYLDAHQSTSVLNHDEEQNNEDLLADERIPVLIDGNPGGPVLLRCKNLNFFITQENYDALHHANDEKCAFMCSIGVGRLLGDTVFQVTSVDEQTQKVITQHPISGNSNNERSIRCHGNLEAIEQYLKLFILGYHTKVCSDIDDKKPLIWKVTDLNVALALNAISCGVLEFQLDSNFSSIIQRIQKGISFLTKKRTLFFRFEPPRIYMDGCIVQPPKKSFQKHSQRWKARYSALKTGSYKIYPCPHENHLDAMEVRYMDSNSNNRIILYQELYLDYGEKELVYYVKNVIAMKQIHRLMPKTLAQVDPQVFWSALLHANAFISILKDFSNRDPKEISTDATNLYKTWNCLLSPATLAKNRINWYNAVHDNCIQLPVNVINGNDWSKIDSKSEYLDIGSKCALGALFMMLKIISKSNEEKIKKLEKEVDTQPKMDEYGRVHIELLDFYKGTIFDSTIRALSKQINESIR